MAGIHPGQPHQVPWQPLITAGKVDAGVKRRSIGVDLDHIGDHLPAGQAEIDPIRPLALPVTDIRAEIPGAEAPGLRDPFPHLLHQDL